MKRDQQRVRMVLADTVTLLCRNGLAFQHELRIQGVIGITIDKLDAFIVHINETFHGISEENSSSDGDGASVKEVIRCDAERSKKPAIISPPLVEKNVCLTESCARVVESSDIGIHTMKIGECNEIFIFDL